MCRSAFFCFCNDERPKVKAAHPNYTVGDIAKELGRRWETCSNKAKYEALAAKDKARYEQVWRIYRCSVVRSFVIFVILHIVMFTIKKGLVETVDEGKLFHHWFLHAGCNPCWPVVAGSNLL